MHNFDHVEGKRYSNKFAEDTIRSLRESGHIDDARPLVEEDGRSIRVFVEVEERSGFGPCLLLFTCNTAFADPKLAKVICPSLKGPTNESQMEAARRELEALQSRAGLQADLHHHVLFALGQEERSGFCIRDRGRPENAALV